MDGPPSNRDSFSEHVSIRIVLELWLDPLEIYRSHEEALQESRRLDRLQEDWRWTETEKPSPDARP